MNQSELQLLKKCQEGNMEGFGTLYDLYIKKIYNFIYYKTNHKETAEDLVSKTFFKALKNINKLELGENTSFSSWIYRIARNTVIDYYRTKKENFDINDFWDLKTIDEPNSTIDNNQALKEVKEYMSKLSEEQREIITLRVWEGLSHQEIAQIIGKTENSTKMAFSRAVKKIRADVSLETFIALILLS